MTPTQNTKQIQYYKHKNKEVKAYRNAATTTKQLQRKTLGAHKYKYNLHHRENSYRMRCKNSNKTHH